MKSVEIMLQSSLEIRHETGKVFSAEGSAEAAGDFCFDFDHSHALFGQVIGKRDSEIMDKQAYFPLVLHKAVNQRAAFAFFLPAFLARLLLRERVPGNRILEE